MTLHNPHQLTIPGIPVPPWHPDAVLEHWEDPLDRIDAIEAAPLDEDLPPAVSRAQPWSAG
jgi:hypothetical protein